MGKNTKDKVKDLLNEVQDNNHKKVLVYALDGCPACDELKNKFEKIGLNYESIKMNGNDEMWADLEKRGGSEYAPQAEVDGYLIKESEYENMNDLISCVLTNLLSRKIVVK